MLKGFEVLVRAKNGKDAAPMPGLATFQVQQRQAACRFLDYQIRWATKVALAMNGLNIQVNVRPDELAGAKSAIIEATQQTIMHFGAPKLVFEITEYSPIDDAVKALLKELSGFHQVQFALDDINAVKEGKGFAMGNHASTFELAKELSECFMQLKIDLKLSAQVWDVPVFPKPEWAGGKTLPFFEGMRLKFEVEQERAQIKERVELVEDLVQTVRATKPDMEFVFEASVHPEDLKGDPERYPKIDMFTSSHFLVQGGHSGGRAFPPGLFKSWQ